jgi:acetyl-CoA/propionyl-CoA carboxylase carboxyl transferase subunit
MLAAVGMVDGTPAVAFCSDATVMGGAMGDLGCKVVVDVYHRAMTDQVPIIGLWHSGGARLAEGVLSLHAVGQILQVMTQASGKISQVSVVLGPAAGGAWARSGTAWSVGARSCCTRSASAWVYAAGRTATSHSEC